MGKIEGLRIDGTEAGEDVDAVTQMRKGKS